MYDKSAEELQQVESKHLMKFTVIATMESLWHNFSGTCERASACFKKVASRPSNPSQPPRRDLLSLKG